MSLDKGFSLPASLSHGSVDANFEGAFSGHLFPAFAVEESKRRI